MNAALKDKPTILIVDDTPDNIMLLSRLLKDKYQLSLGVRHRFDCCVVSFAVTENLHNISNTPDVGLTLSVARVSFGR